VAFGCEAAGLAVAAVGDRGLGSFDQVLGVVVREVVYRFRLGLRAARWTRLCLAVFLDGTVGRSINGFSGRSLLLACAGASAPWPDRCRNAIKPTSRIHSCF
jgi:hypothetical protein